ncbi:MAG: hypothetical protein EXS37_02055 [Opitutus sp.]|nr:hypothetical protein [Opitutus sp.]
MKTTRKKHPSYSVVIEWSDEDLCYVARVPALKYCTAHGDTYEEAAREIQDAIAGIVAAMQEKGVSLPPSGPTIDELKEAAELLNVNELGRRIGVSPQTLYTKLRRGSELKPEEASAVARALHEVGLHLVKKAS